MDFQFKEQKEKPLYEQISDKLREEIQTGQLRPGDRLRNEIELAEALGVGRNTVRQAILRLVDEGLVTRGRGQGTFVGQVVGALQSSDSELPNVLFVQPRKDFRALYNPFYHHVLAALDQSFAESGMRLIYVTANDRSDLLRVNHGARVDAIVMAGISERSFLDCVRLWDAPIISVHEWFPDEDIICVKVDNVRGGFLATQHLIETGCKRIACLCGPESNYVFFERIQGYRMALEAYSLPYDEQYVRFAGDTELQSYNVTKELLELDELPDAIFAYKDIAAMGAMGAVKDAGLEIPGDVSIVGYDDQDFSRLLKPTLSTVRQSGTEVGKKTAEVIASLLAGEKLHSKDILVKPELIIRETSTRI
jgi:DNA-binding LacI/PurR family transcriptional regulator